MLRASSLIEYRQGMRCTIPTMKKLFAERQGEARPRGHTRFLMSAYAERRTLCGRQAQALVLAAAES